MVNERADEAIRLPEALRRNAKLYAQLRDASANRVVAAAQPADEAWLAAFSADPGWQVFDRRDNGDWLAGYLGEEGVARASFLRSSALPFVDTNRGVRSFPAVGVPPAKRPAEAIGWLVHTGHCGSTLLARALGELPHTTVLREPSPARWLAADTPAYDRPLADATLRTLTRSFRGERVVVKASSHKTAAVAALAQAFADDARLTATAAVAMVCSLDDHACHFLATTTDDLDVGGPPGLRDVSPADAPIAATWRDRPVAERLALDWLVKMAATQRLASAMPTTIVTSDTLLRAPREVVQAAARGLGLAADDARIDDVFASGVMERSAKQPGRRHTAGARIAQLRAASEQHKDVLRSAAAAADAWCDRRAVFAAAREWAIEQEASR